MSVGNLSFLSLIFEEELVYRNLSGFWCGTLFQYLVDDGVMSLFELSSWYPTKY